MRKSKRIVLRTLAFAKKELKLQTRYKWPFLSTTVLFPILNALPLVVLYWGLITAVPGGVGGVDQSNFLSWVFLGSVIFFGFRSGYRVFRVRFSEEKYWLTIHGTLIAPVSKYYLLFGVIIELAIEAFVTSIVFFTLSILVFPTTLLNLFLVYIIFLMALIAGAGISLVNGAFYLINESYSPIFEIFLYFLVFFSCYSIPYSLYPSFLWFFININPLYHFVNLSRDIWFSTVYSIDIISTLWSVLYISVFCVISIIVGVYFFTRIVRRFGVRGY